MTHKNNYKTVIKI